MLPLAAHPAAHCSVTRIKDLTPLAKAPLNQLNILGTPVSSLAPIQGTPLEKIWCSYRPQRDAASTSPS